MTHNVVINNGAFYFYICFSYINCLLIEINECLIDRSFLSGGWLKPSGCHFVFLANSLNSHCPGPKSSTIISLVIYVGWFKHPREPVIKLRWGATKVCIGLECLEHPPHLLFLTMNVAELIEQLLKTSCSQLQHLMFSLDKMMMCACCNFVNSKIISTII